MSDTITTPDVRVSFLGPSRLAIHRRDRKVHCPPYHFPGGSWVESSDYLTVAVPRDIMGQLPRIFKDHMPALVVTYDTNVLHAIEQELERERQSYTYANANDAPEESFSINIRPFPHQKAAARYLDYDKRPKLLALDMGLGKTAIACEVCERNNYRTLWVTKAALVPNLRRELIKLTGIPPIIFNGRRPTKHDLAALLTSDARHFIINYEVIGSTEVDEADNVSRPWVDTFNMAAMVGKLDACVADEAHNFKNTSAKRTRAMFQLDIPYRLPMTGTPIVNRVPELWPLLHFIDRERFNSEASFTHTHAYDDGRPRNPRKLQEMLLPYMFRRAKADVLKDLPPIIRQHIPTTLPDAAKQRYNLALNGVYQYLNSDAEDEINGILAQLNRLLQIVADAKVTATCEQAREVIDQSNSKVLIFSRFTQPCEQIAVRMDCEFITGDTPHASRLAIMDRFESDPNIRTLVLSIGVGQEGLNLTAADTVIFNDFDWTPKAHRQAEARCYGRLNNLHGATAYYMFIEETIDETVMQLLEKKLGIIESVVEGTKTYASEGESIFRELVNELKIFRPK